MNVRQESSIFEAPGWGCPEYGRSASAFAHNMLAQSVTDVHKMMPFSAGGIA
jgi:hypothetical protein